MIYRIESWAFNTDIEEEEGSTEVHYSSLESANAALSSALTVRIEELSGRADVEEVDGKRYEIIRHEYGGDDFIIQLSWWKNHSEQKDFFGVSYSFFEREVLP